MIWFALGVLVLLLAFAGVRAWKMGPLFADDHLAAVGARLPELKRNALAGRAEEPAAFATAMLVVAYSVEHREGEWVHHVSVSSPVTPARAAGTFFLGLVRGMLRLEAYPEEVFVSQNHVFHLVARLSDKEQRAFAKRAVEPKGTAELRSVAIAGRGVLFPKLQERVVDEKKLAA